MTKEKKTVYYCIRVEASLYDAIHKTAEQEHIKPSTLIRQFIKEKIVDFGTSESAL